MKPIRSEDQAKEQSGEVSRKAWTKPQFSHLRAGSAENIPGSTVSDATLETIGS
jgi:hypothetical protein